MRHLPKLAAIISVAAFPALAQEEETIEEMASEEEVQAVSDAIGAFNCTAPAVEKESDTLFEIDDADCGDAGQFDIKLDGEYNIVSMTRD